MNVLLLQTFVNDEPRSPIALLDLAAFARRHGHTVDVDYTHDITAIGEYDVVGLSALSLTDHTTSALAHIRTLYDGRLILGGKCIGTLTTEDKLALEPYNVELWEGGGESLFSAGAWGYGDYPPWDSKDFDALDKSGGNCEVMSSRGCPYHCHFCHNTETKVSYFTPKRTVDNCTIVLERNRSVFFVDDVFTMKPSRMTSILEEADGAGVELRGRTSFFTHVNLVTPATIQAMQAYNPERVLIGLESGDNRMLTAMNKRFDIARASHALRQMAEAGLHVYGLYLLGFPGEDSESLANTVAFIERTRKWMIGCCSGYYQPVPNTEGWRLAKERLGREARGTWNRDIVYLDPNLTSDALIATHNTIAELGEAR